MSKISNVPLVVYVSLNDQCGKMIYRGTIDAIYFCEFCMKFGTGRNKCEKTIIRGTLDRDFTVLIGVSMLAGRQHSM